MPQNIELKARLHDIEFARQAARNAGAKPQGVLEQTDTYFRARRGRLKLRQITGQPAELIFYDRPNASEIRACRYRRVPVSDPEAMRDLLDQALGTATVVRKRRELWLLDNVRIHLDDVDGLGQFLEFEAIVGPGHPEEVCRRQVDELMCAFAVDAVDLVAVSYGDLISR